ncbi:MAG: acyl--CoA ligase, partial [Nevskia sp.]|nr:acyl--CoA ligase [Nevskia sp.]
MSAIEAPAVLPGTGHTIWSLFEDCVTERPQTRLVFSVEGREHERSMAGLRGEALRLAAGLRERGLEAGDVVMVQFPHCPENLAAFLACMALGVTFVPVVHNYGAAEMDFMLRQSRARLLFMPARWHNFDYPGRARALAGIDTLENIVFAGDALPDCPKALAWSGLLPARGLEAEDLPAQQPRDRCMIIYTSGTTSAPKGAMHCHASLIAEAAQTSAYL